MLYIDGKRKKDLKEFYPALSEAFPYSFTSKGAIPNGEPIKIDLTAKAPVYELFKAGDKNVRVGKARVSPPQQKVSASGVRQNSDGVGESWNYSIRPPKMVGGEPQFESSYITFSTPQSFDPVTDVEKIIALYFFSPAFQNNALARKNNSGKNARFKFVLPNEKYEQKANEISERAKYSNLLIVEGTRLSDESFKEVCELMSVIVEANLNNTRLQVYDIVTKDADFRSRFDRLTEMVVERNKQAKESINIKSIIKKLVEQKRLMVEEGMWVVKNELGEKKREVASVVGEKKAEQEAGLIAFLEASTPDLEYLQSLL